MPRYPRDLYYLARGGGTDTGTVYRISYVVSSPRVDLTANGSDAAITLTPGAPLRVLTSFDASWVSSFQSTTIVNLPNAAAALAPGSYWWFMIIIPTSDPNTSYSDMVMTTIP